LTQDADSSVGARKNVEQRRHLLQQRRQGAAVQAALADPTVRKRLIDLSQDIFPPESVS